MIDWFFWISVWVCLSLLIALAVGRAIKIADKKETDR